MASFALVATPKLKEYSVINDWFKKNIRQKTREILVFEEMSVATFRLPSKISCHFGICR
jgi:hypothetical protein